MKIRRYIWGICYGLMLTVFTVYIVLDTFVIKRIYSDISPIEEQSTNDDIEPEPQNISDSSLVVTDYLYDDENISIIINKYREYDTDIYVADIQIASADYLKTAFVYLLISLFCSLFGAVYEMYSHGVYSFYMIYAFVFPLVGGTLPFSVFTLLRKPKYPGAVSRNLYHSGIATVTVGCIVRGVLDIYGTTNRLAGIYWYAGVSLIGVGIVIYLLRCVTAS